MVEYLSKTSHDWKIKEDTGTCSSVESNLLGSYAIQRLGLGLGRRRGSMQGYFDGWLGGS